MHYVSSRRRSRAAVLVPPRVRHSSAIASGPVVKPQGAAAVARAGGALADAVGRSLRRPDAVAAPLLLMGVGRERAELSASCPAHAASAPRTQLADAVEESSPP